MGGGLLSRDDNELELFQHLIIGSKPDAVCVECRSEAEVCENGEAEVRAGNNQARPTSFKTPASFERISEDFLAAIL